MTSPILHPRVIFAALLGLCLASPLAAQADEAKALFQQGIELFESGQYKEAAESFRAAYSAKASWKMFYNIGQAEAAATRYGLSLEAFEAYLVGGGDDVPADRKEEVLAEIQRLRLLVGMVELDAKPGSELLIDGISRGTTPFEGVVRVAAGRHQVQVKQDGEVVLEKQVKFAGGVSTRIEVGDATAEEQATQPADTADPEPAAQDEVRGKLIAGIVIGGVGLVGVGLGAGFAAKGSKDYDDYIAARDAGDREEFDRLQDDVLPVDQGVMIAGLAGGGALLAAGVVLIVIDVVQHKESNDGVAIGPAPGGIAVSF